MVYCYFDNFTSSDFPFSKSGGQKHCWYNMNNININLLFLLFLTLPLYFRYFLWPCMKLIGWYWTSMLGVCIFSQGFAMRSFGKWLMWHVMLFSGCIQVFYSVQFSYKTSAWTFRTRNMHYPQFSYTNNGFCLLHAQLTCTIVLLYIFMREYDKRFKPSSSPH